MKFSEKLKFAIKKIKGKLIVAAILIAVIIVCGVAPLSKAVADAFLAQPGVFDWEVLFESLFVGLQNPLTAFGDCFQDTYRKTFFGITKFFLGFYGLFVFVGIWKAFPTHEYADIENGSSDWSVNGEQYKILHKKKGIVLAEKNYLPVDKRGNVNVLVVRRFWCW